MNNKKWELRYSGKNEPRDQHDFRSPWMRDHARIIHSASFRRLQSKTQILNLGESDFYRTRLTHSLEVAQVGKGILGWLTSKYRRKSAILSSFPDPDLIEAICLTHDIGHPPFGHGGEVALNLYMSQYGGFEGNGQTLHILTKLDKHSKKNGLDLTRRALLGVLKYPVLHSAVVNQKRYDDGQLQKPVVAEQWKPPKAIFDCDKDMLDWILSVLPRDDVAKFTAVKDGNTSGGYPSHKKSIHKSLDCTIMDLADDISYGVHDLEDAISLKFISRNDWDNHFDSSRISLDKHWGVSPRKIADELFSGSSTVRKRRIGFLVHKFITAVEVKELKAFETDILRYRAYLTGKAAVFLDNLQSLVVNRVIRDPNVQYAEFRGQRIIGKLFEVISSDPMRFLREQDEEEYEALDDECGQKRFICDFVAGMTDDYAIRMYKKLFIPETGSLFDRL